MVTTSRGCVGKRRIRAELCGVDDREIPLRSATHNRGSVDDANRDCDPREPSRGRTPHLEVQQLPEREHPQSCAVYERRMAGIPFASEYELGRVSKEVLCVTETGCNRVHEACDHEP